MGFDFLDILKGYDEKCPFAKNQYPSAKNLGVRY